MFFGHVALGEARVTGVAGATRLKDTPVPTSLVRHAELRHVPSLNIVTAIARQPGVSAVTTGNGIAKPVIRGLGYNRVVSVADGVRQEGQQWGDEHGLEIDAAGVHSVEILKGPASLMYGSDAMAGVIVFRPAPLMAEGQSDGSLEATYQTNGGAMAYTANYAGNRGGFVWDARWSQTLAHAYKTPRDGYVPGSQFRQQAARARLGLQRNWGHSLLTLGYYHLTPGIVEGERDEETGGLEAPEGWRARSYGKSLPFQQVAHYKAVLDHLQRVGHGTLAAIVGYQQNCRQEYEDSPRDYALYFQQHTLTYDLRYTLPLSDAARLHAGVNGMWQRSLNKGDEYLIPAYALADVGFFVTGTQRLGAFLLSGGLRYDRRALHSEGLSEDGVLRFTDFRRHFDGLTGSLGAVWHAARGLDVRLNVARGFRAPNLAELGSNGEHEGTVRYEVGNSRLHAERSLQADLGADYVGHFVSAQVALFVSRIDHYVYARRNGQESDDLPFYEYASGDACLRGFEAGLDFHPIHSLHFQNTFAFVRATQLHRPAPERSLPLTPAPRWNSELKWEVAHEPRRLWRKGALAAHNAFVAVGLECNLRQGHFYEADATETATPSYTLLSLSAGSDVLLRGRKVAEVLLICENLANRAYQSHLSRLKYAGVNPVTGRMGVCGPGRNVTLRVTVPF
ncbi:MAG: TonB-dependent receptor [Bacteroidaceae bacterium]|nr:TonB-dependent receptor [Bacteroidaceae bacterium]